MNKIKQIVLVSFLAMSVAGCFNSSSDNDPAPVEPNNGGTVGGLGSSTDGKTYYNNSCGSCHAAGADDTSTAFGSSDLAQKQDRIVNDMSAYDATTQLMTQFNNVSQQRVNDLKAYLATL